VRLLQREAGADQVHAGQHRTDLSAVRRVGCQAVAAGQARHHRRRLAGEHVHESAQAVGLRRRHGNPLQRQVLHEPQVVGQLFRRKPFEQRQHPLATRRGGAVVGVLDARADALQIGQGAQAQALEERVGLVEADLGVDRHGAV